MITLMERVVGEVVANGQDLSLFGDNMVVDLDLSHGNLPVGSRVRVGPVLCEVTPKPHRGCAKYAVRFGQEARALLGAPDLADRSLRGKYLRALEPGRVSVGDVIEVLSRP